MGTLTKENKELFDTLIEQATTTGNGAFDFGKDKFDALYKMLYKSPVPLTFNELVHNRDFPVISWEDVSKFTSIAALVGLIKIVPVLPQQLGQVTPGEYHKAELTQMGIMCYEDVTGDRITDIFRTRKIHTVMSAIPGAKHIKRLLYQLEVLDQWVQGDTEINPIRIDFDGQGAFQSEQDIYNFVFSRILKRGRKEGKDEATKYDRPFSIFGEYPIGIKPSVFGMPGIVQPDINSPFSDTAFELTPEQQKEFTEEIEKRFRESEAYLNMEVGEGVAEVFKNNKAAELTPGENSFNCDICFGSGRVTGYAAMPGKGLTELKPTDCFKCGGSGNIGGVDIAEGKDSGTIQTEIEVPGTDKVHIVTGGRGSGKTHIKHLNIIGEKSRQMANAGDLSFDMVSTAVQHLLKNMSHKELAEHTNFTYVVANYMQQDEYIKIVYGKEEFNTVSTIIQKVIKDTGYNENKVKLEVYSILNFMGYSSFIDYANNDNGHGNFMLTIHHNLG